MRLLNANFLSNLKHFVSFSFQILVQKTSEEGVGQNVISAEVFAVSSSPSIITSIIRLTAFFHLDWFHILIYLKQKKFQKHLFPQYPELGLKVFNYMVRCGGASKSSKHMSASIFRQQADRLLSVVPDEKIVELYVKVMKVILLFQK